MKKWSIVYGEYSNAVKTVFAAVSAYVTVSCVRQSELDSRTESENNLIFVGENPYIEPPQGGYRIKVFHTPAGLERIVLTGDGAVNTLYAAVDFKNKYLVRAENAHMSTPVYYFNRLFSDPMPDYDESFRPAIRDRALWSWGYVVYDYRGYIDNMVKLKLNMLILWNDYPPENARELVAYAHSCGVKVIWGFSWGWALNCSQADVEHLDQITDEVLTVYERDYAHLGGDGIYFQTFTETVQEEIGGVIVADAAVRLVNQTAARLLERHPGLVIQFGLHALSVKNRLEYISRVDPRVTILWEDCGAFPYSYIPKNTEGFDETAAFTEKIKNLRPAGFGTLFKGLTALDWSTFSHQPGPYVIGEYDRRFVDKKAEEKRRIWKYIQAYWITNAKYLHEIVRKLDSDTLVAALAEDGAFERNIWYPIALYAQMLWNPDRTTEEILTETALMPDVTFA